MSLKIRLARAGSKKRPYYHVVVADVRSPRDGRFIEQIGSWNPLLPKDGERVKVDADRVKHWLGHGALPTDRVARFLDEAGITKREARSNPTKALPGKKAQERAAERQPRERGGVHRLSLGSSVTANASAPVSWHSALTTSSALHAAPSGHTSLPGSPHTRAASPTFQHSRLTQPQVNG